MTEQLISKETAILAKEKGFNIYQTTQYSQGVNPTTTYNYSLNQWKLFGNELYAAPTLSLLQKWLREKHNLYICISAEFYKTGINHTLQILCYNPNLSESDYYDNDKCTGMYGDNAEFNTYEEALEFGLQKALTFVP